MRARGGHDDLLELRVKTGEGRVIDCGRVGIWQRERERERGVTELVVLWQK